MKLMIYHKRYENHDVDDITMNSYSIAIIPCTENDNACGSDDDGGDDPFRVCVDPAVHM